jgi:hypothetical protein
MVPRVRDRSNPAGHTGGVSERSQRAKSGERRSSRRADDEPVLPEPARDERDIGWGDAPSERDDEWYRRERPPHHE